VASTAGKREYGVKEDESSTGRDWAAGFHHVTARSRLARVLKLINRLFIWFYIYFGPREPRITETVHTESIDRLYLILEMLVFQMKRSYFFVCYSTWTSV
jgi:hypothetical protein